MKKSMLMLVAILSTLTITGCSNATTENYSQGNTIVETSSISDENKGSDSSESNSTTSTTTSVQINGGAIYSANDLFTDRDLNQTPDLDDAIYYTLTDGEDITISEEGIYVLQGTANDVTVYVEASKEEKVQIVLDGVSITNSDFPCIYIKQADKVFITTTDSENTLEVTDGFIDDGETNTNGVIFSKDDITLNGIGTLTINSTKNGIVGKDDLKITGGTYYITASKKAIDANDSIRISDGTFVLNAGTDGLHAENNDDDSLGYIYIGGGKFRINAGDDAIHANSIVQIDDGDITITGSEGIEGTYVQINGGNIDITASDDGINAAHKSDSYEVAIEINDGYIKITMGAGDTDGIDSNGNLYIHGGTLDITARSPADYDGIVVYDGGTFIVDGEEYDYVPNQMMGGGRGGMGNKGGMGGNLQGGQNDFEGPNGNGKAKMKP